MYCTNCHTQNVNHAKYCKNCGAPITKIPQSVSNTGVNISGIFILIYLGGGICLELLRLVIQKIVPEWYDGPAKYIIFTINVTSAALLILVGFSIKNVYAKVIGVFLALLFIIYLTLVNANWVFGLDIF